MTETNIGRLVLAFRVVAFIEALTWVALLAGMYIKYAHDNEGATMIPGSLHGAAFVVLVILTLAVAKLRGWDLRTLALGLVATVVPFCSVVFEVWAHRTGRLTAPANGAAPERAAVDSAAR